MKIVIYVDGGNVQGVYSTKETVEVELVDFDNLRADGKDYEERDRILDEARRGLHGIF